MRTIIVKLKNGHIIRIEMGENDCPIKTIKEHGIKTTTKYQLL